MTFRNIFVNMCTVASLHVVACPLLPERPHSSFKAAPADACKLISIAEWRDPVADTCDHPRRCCLQRFRTETAGGVCTFGIQPKPFERKMRSFVTIANTQGTWSTQTNKQTNSKISPAMYHNTHIFWYSPFKYTVFFDPGSVKKIEIFGRELPLRRASVSKKICGSRRKFFWQQHFARFWFIN